MFKDLISVEKTKEYELGEVCEVLTGISFKEKDYKPNGQPILKVRNIRNGEILTENLKYFNPEDFGEIDKLKIRSGDVVVVKDASVGKIGINLTDLEFIHDGHIFKITPNPEILDRKYLYYYLLNFPEKIKELVIDGMIPSIRKSDFLKFKISIPSLQSQKRITHKLDLFTELKKELKLRKKQHFYFRDQIFNCLLENKNSKE